MNIWNMIVIGTIVVAMPLAGKIVTVLITLFS